MVDIAEKVREARLRWYEHVIRKDEGELVRDIMERKHQKTRRRMEFYLCSANKLLISMKNINQNNFRNIRNMINDDYMRTSRLLCKMTSTGVLLQHI